MESMYVDKTDCVEVTLTFKEKIMIFLGIPVSGDIMVGRTEIDKMTGLPITVVDEHDLKLL